MPEGTLERTAALTREIGDYLKTVPEVANFRCALEPRPPFQRPGDTTSCGVPP